MLRDVLGQSIGKGLSDFTNDYYANKSLEGVLGDKSLATQPYSERVGALQKALNPYGEAGAGLLQQRLGVEQQRSKEQESKVLSKVLRGEEVAEEELSQVSPQNQAEAFKIMKQKKVQKNIEKALIENGVTKERASHLSSLIDVANIGGQTEIWKTINDEIKRAKNPEETEVVEKEKVPVKGMEDEFYDFPEQPNQTGRTAKEEISRQDSNSKFNLPIYQDVVTSLKGYEDEYRNIQQATRLNDTRKLPEGSDKWNIDWESGDARAIALLNPETQLFVKTIADFALRAKDFFPGRVTNFDLESYKKRLPTLANSYDGRRLILKQMDIANRVSNLREETLRSAYEHYGSDADPIFIRQQADKNYNRLKQDLENRLKDLDGMLETKYQEDLNQGDDKAQEGELTVYDSEGKVAGFIPANSASKLPKGYEAR